MTFADLPCSVGRPGWCGASSAGSARRRHVRSGRGPEQDPRIAAPRMGLTDRAGRWATEQVGRHGRSVSEVADDLACDWHTVDGRRDRATAPPSSTTPTASVTATRSGWTRRCSSVTARSDGSAGRPRSSTSAAGSSSTSSPVVTASSRAPGSPPAPRRGGPGSRWATLDLSASYKSVFDTMLPDAVQVADPFHVVRLANQALDECRRRVQNETLGHRGRKTDPLYRCRRRLVMARERLSVDGHDKLLGLLAAGDPKREVWFAWNAKEVVRQIYDHTDHQLAVDVGRRDRPRLRRRPRCRSRCAASAAPSARWRAPDRRLAPLPRLQRADRGGQQLRQARQARGVRVPPLRPLPDPLTALRRSTQLDPPPHHHTPLKSEAPHWAEIATAARPSASSSASAASSDVSS